MRGIYSTPDALKNFICFVYYVILKKEKRKEKVRVLLVNNCLHLCERRIGTLEVYVVNTKMYKLN